MTTEPTPNVDEDREMRLKATEKACKWTCAITSMCSGRTFSTKQQVLLFKKQIFDVLC